MSSYGSYGGDTEILLEVGTNELQIMEFTINGRNFGINLAKILEIMQYEPVTPIPHTSPFIEGVFKPRDKIITVVNLASYLGLPDSPDAERDIMIITSFNNLTTAFHVHTVELIRRISWTALEKPDKTIYNTSDSLTVGIARIDERLITILDFEKILSDIGADEGLNDKAFDAPKYRREITSEVYVAEDSMFLSEMLLNCLHKAGYKNIVHFNNGQEVWDRINELQSRGDHVEDHVACIITDIEMPQMDGYTLVKNIKTSPVLKKIPVVIFSSLITTDIKEKGEKLGADAQISKPEIEKLVSIIDSFVLERKK